METLATIPNRVPDARFPMSRSLATATQPELAFAVRQRRTVGVESSSGMWVTRTAYRICLEIPPWTVPLFPRWDCPDIDRIHTLTWRPDDICREAQTLRAEIRPMALEAAVLA